MVGERATQRKGRVLEKPIARANKLGLYPQAPAGGKLKNRENSGVGVLPLQAIPLTQALD
jgi:hypothetical protein